MKDLHELHQQIEALTQEFKNLAERLDAAASRLREPGEPFPTDLEWQTSSLRLRFEKLAAEVLSRTGIHETDRKKTPASLAECSQLLKSFESSLAQSIVDELRELVDTVLKIRHIDSRDFPPLLECQAHAKEVRKLLSQQSVPRDLNQEQRTEGFKHLVEMIRSHDSIPDERWMELEEFIEKVFSRPLRVAVSRGKLVIPTEDKRTIEKPGEEVVTGPVEKEPIIAPSAEPLSSGSSPSQHKKTRKKSRHDSGAHVQPAAPAGTAAPEVEIEANIQAEDSMEPVAEQVETANDQVELLGDSGIVSKEAQPADQKGESAFPSQAAVTAEHAKTESLETGLNTVELASRIQSRLPELAPELLNELIWCLIAEGHPELACHLAVARNRLYPDLQSEILPEMIKAVIVGRRVGFPAGELSQEIQSLLENFRGQEKAGRKDVDVATRLMWAASAVRASLFAPHTGAGHILAMARPDCGGGHHLADLCKGIADLSEMGKPFNPMELVRTMDSSSWETLEQNIRRQASDWFRQAPNRTIKYAPATKVWRSWLERDGIIFNLLQPVIDPSQKQTEALRTLLQEFINEGCVQREISLAEKRIGRSRFNPIEGPALAKLKDWFWEARQIAQQWLDHQQLKPGGKPDFHQQQVDRLHRLFDQFGAGALQELRALIEPSTSLRMRAGAQCMLAVLEELCQMINAADIFRVQEPSLHELVNAELLKIKSLRLNDQLEAEDHDLNLIEKIISFISENDWDWKTAFQERCHTGNHHLATRIIVHLSSIGETEEKITIMKNQLQEDAGDWRRRLKEKIDNTYLKIGWAVARGGIDERQMGELQASLHQVEQVIAETLDFDQAAKILTTIEQTIDHSQQSKIAQVRLRLDQLNMGANDSRQQRIQQVLENKEIIIAQEYIDRVAANQPIADQIPKHTDVLDDFFIRSLTKLEEYLEETNTADVIRHLKHRSVNFPLRLDPISGKQAEQASEMLRTWFELKRKQKAPDPELVRFVLQQIGFAMPKLIDKQPGKLDGVWLTVETESIQDRARCPLPAYGSAANGKYRIFCVWDRPNEEDLLDAVASRPQPHPVIVFHFGRLTMQRRRELARYCRIRRKTFIVLDDCLLLFICGERGSRLPVFFQCALPFTFNEPYTASASMIAPEMFYGRLKEAEYLADAKGSAFIYGGRQLGKTALLRHIEQTHHVPDQGRIAIWLDLKILGIGLNRGIEDLWTLIHDHLGRYIESVRKLPPNTNPQKIADTIAQWVIEDHSRRVLLLLDEADQFLQSDGTESVKGTNFFQCSRLRDLVNRTNGRFKAVLAGLHNVQRATKDANNALAHFATGLGGAICIGPLLMNGEAGEARALVEYPMASLGYRFESEDLIYRILSQTNYYPSLIQLFCSKLLQHLNETPVLNTFDPKNSPPFVITARHVDEAYQSQELREGIRSRFDLTLQLDDRYRLIAYCFALFSEEQGTAAVSQGRSAVWAWKEATSWWSAGFKNQPTIDSFKVILDEMVGLGILRTTGENHDNYTIRNPNILALLGSHEELEKRLEAFENQQTPVAYEPATFRSVLTDEPTRKFIRNPLTAEQESSLRRYENGVTIIAGVPAAGLADLEVFLIQRFSSPFFVKFTGPSSCDMFKAQLDQLTKRHDDGITLVLVPSEVDWTWDWVEPALEKCQRLTSRSSYVRIAFVANPSKAQSLVSIDPDFIQTSTQRKVDIISLHPWHESALRQWLTDSMFPFNQVRVWNDLRLDLGLWPMLLYKWYDECVVEPQRWRGRLDSIVSELNDSAMSNRWLGAFGLGSDPEADRFFRTFGDIGAASVEELSGLIDGFSDEDVKRLMTWAEMLAIGRRAVHGKLELDSVVNTILNPKRTAS